MICTLFYKWNFGYFLCGRVRQDYGLSDISNKLLSEQTCTNLIQILVVKHQNTSNLKVNKYFGWQYKPTKHKTKLFYFSNTVTYKRFYMAVCFLGCLVGM